MANTYSQIFYHVVFAVRNRESLIIPAIKEDMYKYISGIITNQNQKLFIINGMPDHVHILMNCNPNMNLSDNVREIKEHSTKFINDKLSGGNLIGSKDLVLFLFQKKMLQLF
ncbi:MAG TPA: IS200/IS605 family transposase [Bacteroidales bacterium]|nr:IS200/IS605 family transposase [Bacteroidales bacterium]HQI69342.1 IS200/IS605 family transposase [Bacteroidales bacterium]